jgi:2-oxoglutarate ferredoxin oxidoreductase subunit alpha
MQEFIGLASYTDTPAVFFDIQRCGPATGMPKRTQQADLLSLAYASHGDTKLAIELGIPPADMLPSSWSRP